MIRKAYVVRGSKIVEGAGMQFVDPCGTVYGRHSLNIILSGQRAPDEVEPVWRNRCAHEKNGVKLPFMCQKWTGCSLRSLCIVSVLKLSSQSILLKRSLWNSGMTFTYFLYNNVCSIGQFFIGRCQKQTGSSLWCNGSIVKYTSAVQRTSHCKICRKRKLWW